MTTVYLLAVLGVMFALIVTVEEFPVKKLHTDHSKYELRTEVVRDYLKVWANFTWNKV